MGLQCNKEKTTYMVVRRKLLFPVTSLDIGNYNSNKMEQFKYLRTLITEHSEVSREVVARIQAGNKCYYGLEKNIGVTIIIKRTQLYVILFHPLILYGAETWPLRKLVEKKFTILEWKIFSQSRIILVESRGRKMQS